MNWTEIVGWTSLVLSALGLVIGLVLLRKKFAKAFGSLLSILFYLLTCCRYRVSRQRKRSPDHRTSSREPRQSSSQSIVRVTKASKSKSKKKAKKGRKKRVTIEDPADEFEMSSRRARRRSQIVSDSRVMRIIV